MQALFKLFVFTLSVSAVVVHAAEFSVSPPAGGDTWSLGSAANQWISRSTRGYIAVPVPEYVDVDTVAITNGGDGFCLGRYFSLTNRTYDLTSLASAQDFHYGYLDFDQSTFPSNISIYDSTSEPARVENEGGGYYNGTNLSDKCLFVMFSTNGAAELRRYFSMGEFVLFSAGPGVPSTSQNLPTVFLNANPDSTWQVPNIQDMDVLTPVNVKEVWVWMRAHDSNSDTMMFFAPAEVIDAPDVSILGSLFSISGTGPALVGRRGRHTIVLDTRMVLGLSRKVKGWGHDNDDNFFSLFVKGFSYNL